MFIKPPTHFLIGPGPFEGMGIEAIVLGPRRFDVVDQRLATRPRAAFQVAVAERVIEQLGLIEPRGVNRGEARPPPRVVFEVSAGSRRRMTGIPILNQEDTVQVTMVVVKALQRVDVMSGVFALETASLHPTPVHDQKHQHIDGAMTHIVKFPLLDESDA